MTSAEQQAIYDKIHEVQVELIKDNQTSHNEINDSITELTLKVQKTNGLKTKLEEIADAQLKHLAEHEILDKQKGSNFNKVTTIISVGIAVCMGILAFIGMLA